MEIVEATIHHLIKAAQTKGDGSVVMMPRAAALPVDEVLKNLCSDLLALYGKTANSYGTLGQDPSLHVFPVRLRDYVRGLMNFQDLTTTALSLIADKMKSAMLANGGFALFLRYTHAGEDFFLIAMLKLRPGAGIDEQTLSLEPTLSIDLSLLHEAARINLTRWGDEQEPYLSFIKGRARTGDVTDYFRDALACQNFTSSSHHTQQVIKAADAFVEARADLATPEQKLEERIQMRKRLHDCFVANQSEVVLTTLAAAIMPSHPEEFVSFLRTGSRASEFQVNEVFTPHKATYAKIRRITGKIGTSVSVGFDVADVQAQRVYYDEACDGIVLKSPPEHLKKAILENARSA